MRPLEGIQVLDLSANIAGPLATSTLARLGARIIKVERPAGDPSRQWAPFVDGTSLTFDALNRGKESVVLDLTTEVDRALLEAIAATSDVFVHNYTPDVLAKLRLTEQDVKAMNPDLLYCTVGAFGGGEIGSRLPGYDGVAQAFTGIMEMTGQPDSPPTRCAPAVVDVSTGQWLVVGILAALLGRDRGTAPSAIETTLVDTAISMVPYQATEALLTGVRPPKYGTGSPLGAPHEVFPTADRPIFIGAPSQNLWHSLVTIVLEAPQLLDDERFASNDDRLLNVVALRAEMAAQLSARPAAEWIERLAAAGIPTSEVLGLEETVVHPLSGERRWFEPAVGAGAPIVRLPILVDDQVVATATTSPRQGEHTDAIRAEFGAGLATSSHDAGRIGSHGARLV
jgi:crotonobetainyl-CoA:carnitine CoA-transferase CaiB-like acyl-CoA transferase